jgi:O-antigen/teichoic acid export membrane protein
LRWMATLRTVTKNVFLYTLSTVLQRASSIIFFPIFSYYLTKGDYGTLSVVYFVTQFINILCGLEFSRTATRLIHDSDDVEARAKEIYGTYFLLMFVFHVLVVALLLFIGPWLMRPFLNDVPFSPYMVLTMCAMPFVSTYFMYRSYLQATHQGTRFVQVDFLYFLSNVGFNLFFVIVFDMGAAGIILSTGVSSFAFAVYSYFRFFRHTRLSFDKKVLREGLQFSLSLVPFILMGVLLEWTDKMMLNAKVGKEAGGILYIAVMFAAFFTVLRESCNQALVPWFYGQYDKVPEAYVRKVLYATFAGLAILAVCMSWFSHEILMILSSNAELVEAHKYAPFIVNTALVVFLGQIFNMTVMYFKRLTRYLFVTTLVALPVNVLISYLLIDRYGIYGANISNFLAMTTMTIACGVLSHRSGFTINYLYFIAVIALSVALSVMMVVLQLSFWPMLGLKIAIALVMGVMFYSYVSRHFKVRELVMSKLQPVLALVQRSRGV